MNWLIPLPRFGDTRVAAHWTVLAACLASLLLHISAAGPESSPLGPILTLIVILASLALHDAVHLLIGRWYGQFPYRIIIFPTGSRFWFRGQPPTLLQDIVLYLAAPLANLALAFSAYIIRRGMHDDQLLFSWLVHWPPGSVLEIFQNCNSFLFLANLIPVYPLDCGRLLGRVLGAFGMPHHKVVHTVALVGDIFGGIAVFIGLYLSPWLLFLGVLTILGSQGAMELERMSRTLHSLTVKDALVKDILVLTPTTLLEDAARIALREDQREILVGTSQTLRGVISFDRLLHELRERGPLASLKDLELDKTPWIQDEKLPLADAYDILESFQLSLVPLIGPHREIVGCITERSIQNCLLLAEAQHEGDVL